MQNGKLFAVAFLVAVLTAPVVAAEVDTTASTTCRCVMTLAGEGLVKQSMCDGFVPATHQRCDCEKIELRGQPACKPKGDSTRPAASAQRREPS